MREIKTKLLILLAFLALSGCESQKSERQVDFATTYGSLEFSFPGGWYMNTEDHPYDLQAFSPRKEMNSGFFVYLAEDLSEDATPDDIFEAQIQDLISKRRNTKVAEGLREYQGENTQLKTVVYSGDLDLSKYLYVFTLIEFKDVKDRFAVAIQVSFPSSWDDQKLILESIVKSGRVVQSADIRQR